MSRLAIPVIGHVLTATGDVRLRVQVRLALRDSSGHYIPWRFRIDSATDVTTFSAFEARLFGLPLPINPSPIHHDPTGLEVRSGLLRFQINGMDQTEYVLSCFFLGDPNVAPDPTASAFLPQALLQPLALLDHLKFTLAKDAASIGAQYGEVIIEKK